MLYWFRTQINKLLWNYEIEQEMILSYYVKAIERISSLYRLLPIMLHAQLRFHQLRLRHHRRFRPLRRSRRLRRRFWRRRPPPGADEVKKGRLLQDRGGVHVLRVQGGGEGGGGDGGRWGFIQYLFLHWYLFFWHFSLERTAK